MAIDTRQERAVQLRLAGLSRSQIADALGLGSGGQPLSRWLQGVPPPAWTRRPWAKDDVRERAVAMRKEGRSYREIQQIVGVAKSTLSLWLRDVPLTEEQQRALADRGPAAATARAEATRANATRRRLVVQAQAKAQVTHLGESELFVAGVLAYWAEGCKNKPWRYGQGDDVHQLGRRPDSALPTLAHPGRRRSRPPCVPADDPRVGGHNGRIALLVAGRRRAGRVLREDAAQEAQPQDGAEERGRGLPRLPRHLRPSKR